MPEHINLARRRFFGRVAMTTAAASLGTLGATRLLSVEPQGLAALDHADGWLNSPRLTAASLRGKVVLVNFCTYTCINWLRTLPYVRAWAQKYQPGLITIGVHTPEFAFEQDLGNVRHALEQMKVDYPIAIDNDYSIWRAFDNHYWPALYFIDASGRIREHHFGEGEYEWCEKTIQRLLADTMAPAVGNGFVSVHGAGVEAAPDWDTLKSPENYLGYARTERFVSPGGGRLNQRRVYAAPAGLSLNQWALAGEWTMGRQATVLDGDAGRIVCRFHARDLHLVMGPRRREAPVRFRVSIDGRPPGAAHGSDVDDRGHGSVADQRLYHLIRQHRPVAERTFEIEFLSGGVEAFAFTFG